MKKRNIVLAVILSFITCGIYVIYWFICLTNDSNEMSETDKTASGGMAWLFSILTCGLYGWYWAYKLGKKVGDSGFLYFCLHLFSLEFIFAQSKINNYIDHQSRINNVENK